MSIAVGRLAPCFARCVREPRVERLELVVGLPGRHADHTPKQLVEGHRARTLRGALCRYQWPSLTTDDFAADVCRPSTPPSPFSLPGFLVFSCLVFLLSFTPPTPATFEELVTCGCSASERLASERYHAAWVDAQGGSINKGAGLVWGSSGGWRKNMRGGDNRDKGVALVAGASGGAGVSRVLASGYVCPLL